MSFPLKVLWVVKKLHHLASPKWIFIHTVCASKFRISTMPILFGHHVFLDPRCLGCPAAVKTGGSDLMAMTYTIGYEKKNINHHCTPAVSPFIS